MSYDDVEAELRGHPEVEDCAVLAIPTGPRRRTLVAYVVTTGPSRPADLRAFLSAPRLRSHRIPRAVIPVKALPRTSSGEVDRGALPLPVQPGQVAGGKGSLSDLGDTPLGVVMLVVAGIVAAVAFLTTDAFWPGSTDLSVVPQARFRLLFTGLYVAECLSFGLGTSFLFLGRRRMTRLGRPPWLTTLAHLSIGWLLAAWWPQDNFYRLAAKTDWARQAALVYGFNITLMIAAAVLVAFAVHERTSD
jgi:hypothetical protein